MKKLIFINLLLLISFKFFATGEPSTYFNIDKLLNYCGSTFIEKMIRMFISSTDEYFLKMNLAIKENDLDQMNKLAHYIKPSVDLLNINSIRQSIREIEKATEISNDLIQVINYTNQELQLASKQMQNDYK